MTRSAHSRLPAQVAEFLEEFALTGLGEKAAVNVGVHPKIAARFVRETMAHPDARDAFDLIMRSRFSHAGPMALNLLVDIVANHGGPYETRVRVDAAKTLLDRSGYSAKALAAPGAAKDLHEYTRDELLQVVNQGETELASRAKLIGNVAINTAIDVQVIDIEE